MMSHLEQLFLADVIQIAEVYSNRFSRLLDSEVERCQIDDRGCFPSISSLDDLQLFSSS